MTQLPWPATHSLLREELLDIPTTVYGDPLVDAPLQALLAGEPQRALALLTAQPPDPRSAEVLTAWARQLDRNWYPGDIGAETAVVTPDAFIQPKPDDHPATFLLAMLVLRGPTALRVPRTLMEMSLRAGAMQGVQEALANAAQSIDAFTQYANQTGQPALLPWLALMRADFSRRAGIPQDADVLLAQARQQAALLQSPPRMALTYLVEGDWYAAPGSSPESLGWDLAPIDAPSPLPHVTCRAPQHCGTRPTRSSPAGTSRASGRPSRSGGRGRRRLAGVPDTQRQYLASAKDLSRRAGDTATYHLAVVHELVADIDDGLLGQHLLQLGGGWSPPQHGPVAELLQWAETAGSRSWCVGLGRLLQRCGDRWNVEGSAPRARVAYLAALPLVSSDPSVPGRTLQTAVAHVDGRLEPVGQRAAAAGPGLPDTRPPGGHELYDFAEMLEASASMIGALRDRTAWCRSQHHRRPHATPARRDRGGPGGHRGASGARGWRAAAHDGGAAGRRGDDAGGRFAGCVGQRRRQRHGPDDADAGRDGGEPGHPARRADRDHASRGGAARRRTGRGGAVVRRGARACPATRCRPLSPGAGGDERAGGRTPQAQRSRW